MSESMVPRAFSSSAAGGSPGGCRRPSTKSGNVGSSRSAVASASSHWTGSMIGRPIAIRAARPPIATSCNVSSTACCRAMNASGNRSLTRSARASSCPRNRCWHRSSSIVAARRIPAAARRPGSNASACVSLEPATASRSPSISFTCAESSSAGVHKDTEMLSTSALSAGAGGGMGDSLEISRRREQARTVRY